MANLQNTLEKALATFTRDYFSALEKATQEQELEQVRLTYLSRNGTLTELMSLLKTLSPEDKRIWGPKLNQLKHDALAAFEAKQQQFGQEKIKLQHEQQAHFDVTAYLPSYPSGSIHPITSIAEQLENVLMSMGFEMVDGPEVETDFYNFEALNIPETHPAREVHDTFWLKLPHMLLRTHTSNVQIRTMQQRKPPLAIATIARAFRNEATDATHDFMFMQCEGLLVDKDISMGNLLATIKTFVQALFERKNLDIRVRSSYFPFVEPGIEVDISCIFCKSGCSVCKRTGWLELGGAGLVHPRVLSSCGIDPDTYSGFAWGFGLDRIVMLIYGINDIRLLHSGKIDFLKQF